MKKNRLRLVWLAVFAALVLGISGMAQDNTGKNVTPQEQKRAAGLKNISPDANAIQKLDINSATQKELKGLPGIGDAYSKKIIDGRPYTNKRELVTKKILPNAVYEKIAPIIVAKQSGKSK